MRAHVIEGGVVVNTIEVDSLDVFPDKQLLDAALGGSIGDRWDGQMFTPLVSSLEPVPPVVSMRQARLALLGAGMLTAIEAAIDDIEDETQRAAARIEWDYAAMVERSSAFVALLGGAIGLSAEDADDLFRAAVKL